MARCRDWVACIFRWMKPKHVFYLLYVYSFLATLTIAYIDYFSINETDREIQAEYEFEGDISSKVFPESPGAKVAYRYKLPPLAKLDLKGQRFHVNDKYVQPLIQSGNILFRLDQSTVDDFVFVTASGDLLYEESRDTVASIQKYFPHKPIIYYDLGLVPRHISEVQRWCDVTYKTFDFFKYPEHVLDKKRQAWKPLLIMESLQHHGAIFWIDPKVRLNTSDFSIVYTTALGNGGIVHMRPVSYSNFAVTHKHVYTYFPTQQVKQKGVQQVGSGAMLIYKTELVYHHILWWWSLCALDPRCISPISETQCNFDKGDKWTVYGGCHRFDQSVINILLSNLYGYKIERYASAVDVVNTHRDQIDKYHVIICSQPA